MKHNFSYQPINCLLEEVSKEFGANYVKENPNVLAAILIAGAITHAGNQQISEQALFEVSKHIGDKIEATSNAIDNIDYTLGRIVDELERNGQ